MFVNSRALQARTTGVQRYLLEILSQLNGSFERIESPEGATGVKGHLWEQAVLPCRIGKRLLWSPANTGPLALSNQVVTIHDAATLDHPEWFEPKFAAWYGYLLPRLMRRVQRVITVSEFSKERLIAHAGISAHRITVVHNGVAARFRPATAADIQALTIPLGLPERYLLAVGSLEPRKNLGRLFAAWERVRKQLPDTWLVIAGAEGKVFSDSGFQAVPPGVKVLGYVADDALPSLYSGAIAFLYPSVYEGFGLPPLEAMACGAPVLTSNSTALPEVVGDAALLIDPTDIEAIAAGIVRIAEDRSVQAQLRRKGLERAAGFTWETTALETLRLLQQAGS